MPRSQFKPEFIILGAGPNGLYAAANLKLHKPNAKILIVERNEKYTRDYHLAIDKRSYFGSHPSLEFQHLLSQLSGKVPTQQIEQKLKAYLLTKTHIQFLYEKVDDVRSLANRYPSAHTIVGADGAHSLVRRQMFKDEKDIEEVLQYIIKVQYEVNGATEKLSSVNTAEGWSLAQHCVIEYLGKPSSTKTPMALFVFVRKETYDAVRQIDPKSNVLKQILLDTENADLEKLRKTLKLWGTYRFSHKKDIVEPQSVRIGAVELSAYKSKDVAVLLDGKRYILIGDAKLGVPYYRSLNAGLSSCPDAVQLMLTDCKDKVACDVFNKKMHEFGQKEIERARNNNHHALLGRGAAKLTRVFSALYGNDLMNPAVKENLNHLVPRSYYQKHQIRTTVRSFFWFLLFASLFLYNDPEQLNVLSTISLSAISTLIIYSFTRTLLLQCFYEALVHMIGLFRNQPTKDDNKLLEQMVQAFREVGYESKDTAKPLVAPIHYQHPAGLHREMNLVDEDIQLDSAGLYEVAEAFYNSTILSFS